MSTAPAPGPRHLPAYLSGQLTRGLFSLLGDEPECPQGHRCWGPWVLDSDTTDPTLYDRGDAHHARIPLVRGIEAGEKTMNAAVEALAFLVHFQWAGPRVTAGLLNAYTAVYGLTDYDPQLAALRLTAAQVRKLARAAVDDPANVLHVHSLADVEREDAHREELARRAEAREQAAARAAAGQQPGAPKRARRAPAAPPRDGE